MSESSNDLQTAAVGAPHRRYRVFIIAHSQAHASRPHTYSIGPHRTEMHINGSTELRDKQERHAGSVGEDVAHAEGEQSYISELFQGAEAIAQMQFGRLGSNADWWAVESRVCRVADELSEGLDGLDKIAEPHYTMGITNGGNTHANATEDRFTEKLPVLQRPDETQKDQWETRRPNGISQEEVLQSNLHGTRIHSGRCQSVGIEETGNEVSRGSVSGMWHDRIFGGSPSGLRPSQQCTRQPDDIVRFLSHELALETWQESVEATIGVQDLWRACEEIGYVPEALSAIPQVWRSMSDEEKEWVRLRLSSRNAWITEWPNVSRVSTGVPKRVDRLRCLGNAVVPQVAEWIGRRILATSEGTGA